MRIHLIGHAIIQDPDTGSVLLLKRTSSDTTFPELWDIPGGELEPGEDLWDGTLRNIQQQTGLEIEVELGSLIDYTNDIDTDESDQYVRLIFWADGFEQPATLSASHDEFRWVNPRTIKPNTCVPYLEEILTNLN